MAVFEASVPLACSQGDVFEFLVRPANVLRILPPNSGMSYLNAPERLQLGSQVEFQITGMGPVQRMLHEVTHFDEPVHFTETQLKGPLRKWVHEHIVETNGGNVVIVDRIEFEPPGGLLGYVVTEDKLYEMMKAGFEHRHQALKEILEQNGA